MFRDEYTVIAVLCAIAGCLIRYISQWKNGDSIKIPYLISDVLTAAFLGYLIYWVIAEHKMFNPSHASVITCVVGNFGSRVFDIVSWYLHTRFGIPNLKYGEKNESSTRSEK